MDPEEDLDPNYEWLEVVRWGDPQPRYIKGPCLHLETNPVITGCSWGSDEQVATICVVCEAAWDMEGVPL